jgi:hypothetical protein
MLHLASVLLVLIDQDDDDRFANAQTALIFVTQDNRS